MKSWMSRLALVLLLIVSITGCSDPLDLDTIDLDLNFNERVQITAGFENAGGIKTIEKLRVSWDGEVLQELSSLIPVAQVSVSGTRYGRQRGSHRLSFQVLAQTSSPNNYRTMKLIITSYDEQGDVGRTLKLDPRTELLETNATITYDFRIE